MELKVANIPQAIYEIDGTSLAPTLLNGTIPGTQNYNRVGRKIALSSLQFKGYVYPEALATGYPNYAVRVVIVYDNQSNGAAPTWANVVLSQDNAGTSSSAVFDCYNLDNRERFNILHDFTIACPAYNSTATTADNNSFLIDEFINLHDIPTIYNAGTAGTIADIQTGALYAFWVSTLPFAATGIDLDISYRTIFYDY